MAQTKSSRQSKSANTNSKGTQNRASATHLNNRGYSDGSSDFNENDNDYKNAQRNAYGNDSYGSSINEPYDENDYEVSAGYDEDEDSDLGNEQNANQNYRSYGRDSQGYYGTNRRHEYTDAANYGAHTGARNDYGSGNYQAGGYGSQNFNSGYGSERYGNNDWNEQQRGNQNFGNADYRGNENRNGNQGWGGYQGNRDSRYGNETNENYNMSGDYRSANRGDRGFSGMTPDEIRRTQAGSGAYNEQDRYQSRQGRGNTYNDDTRYGGFVSNGGNQGYGRGNSGYQQGNYGRDNYSSSNYGQENYGNGGSFPSYTDYDRGNRGQQQGQSSQSWNEQGGNRNQSGRRGFGSRSRQQ